MAKHHPPTGKDYHEFAMEERGPKPLDYPVIKAFEHSLVEHSTARRIFEQRMELKRFEAYQSLASAFRRPILDNEGMNMSRGAKPADADTTARYEDSKAGIAAHMLLRLSHEQRMLVDFTPVITMGDTPITIHAQYGKHLAGLYDRVRDIVMDPAKGELERMVSRDTLEVFRNLGGSGPNVAPIISRMDDLTRRREALEASKSRPGA